MTLGYSIYFERCFMVLERDMVETTTESRNKFGCQCTYMFISKIYIFLIFVLSEFKVIVNTLVEKHLKNTCDRSMRL